jgi:hypothetical protein
MAAVPHLRATADEVGPVRRLQAAGSNLVSVIVHRQLSAVWFRRLAALSVASLAVIIVSGAAVARRWGTAAMTLPS